MAGVFVFAFIGVPGCIRKTQRVFKSALSKVWINEPINIYGLQHSLATPHRTDIKLIQELLGHNDIKTMLQIRQNPESGEYHKSPSITLSLILNNFDFAK